MKTNKKSILGMLVAMVISLSMMGGMNNIKKTSEPNLFVSCVCISNTELTQSQQYGGAVYSALAGFIYGIPFGGIPGALVGGAVGL